MRARKKNGRDKKGGEDKRTRMKNRIKESESNQ